MLLFYIRHGDPVYSPDSLTPLGCRQAEAVAKRLSLYGLDKIFASTSTRAMQTAKPTCELLKKELTTLDFCNENYAWEQLTVKSADGRTMWGFQEPEFSAFLNSPEIRTLGENWHTHPRIQNTEMYRGIQRIRTETYAFLASLGYIHEEGKYRFRVADKKYERVALFAHQGFGLAFLSCLLDIPYPLFCTHFDMGHSAMSVIEFAALDGYSVPRVLQLSSDSHLYREGLPTKYQNRIYF